MPLRARVDSEEILAPLLDDAAWEARRWRVAEHGLWVTLLCCDAAYAGRYGRAATQVLSGRRRVLL